MPNLEFEHSIPVYNAANSSSFRNGQITSLPRHRDTTELQIVPPMCEETPPQPHVDNDLSGPWINSPSNVLDGNTRTFWRASTMNGLIVFDFTCVVNVTKMYINVVRNGYNNPKRVRLDVLDDAENWVDSQVLDIPSIAGPIGISYLKQGADICDSTCCPLTTRVHKRM